MEDPASEASIDEDVMLAQCPVEPRGAAEFLFCVVSSKRPQNVEAMESKLVGCEVCWFVGAGETETYRDHGAARVVEGGGLCASRNAALEVAFAAGKCCVQISDDVRALRYVHSEHDKAWTKPRTIQEANARAKMSAIFSVSFLAAARYVEARARFVDAYLGGVYPCANEGQALGGPPVATDNFVVGDFIVVRDSAPRFDPLLLLKEDYDFTALHLFTFGKVARANRIIIKAEHYVNEGGAVAVRNKTREAATIKRLRAKWPGVFLNSPRGPSEVRMRWEARDVTIGGTRVFEPDPKFPGRAIYDQEKAKKAREARLAAEARKAANGEPPGGGGGKDKQNPKMAAAVAKGGSKRDLASSFEGGQEDPGLLDTTTKNLRRGLDTTTQNLRRSLRLRKN
ncbi:hypothetical protein CTAYLR_002248 [Chrysophaeum taylorii]|uniref:Uncharacterized protein n=1 Tax=Chrysophaeum taylorii TaxID=2483200 RepID=A0AAD7UQC1_9STRA|nr:hypothetical protein CTAYLR_002248 [Chrysophaeum taylorii]